MFRKLRATLLGYFWLPCPICKEMFGGFEIGRNHIEMEDGRLLACCKNCDFLEANKLDELNRG